MYPGICGPAYQVCSERNSSVVWIGGSGKMSECPQISCHHAIRPDFRLQCLPKRLSLHSHIKHIDPKCMDFNGFCRFQCFCFPYGKSEDMFFWYQSYQPFFPLLKATAAVDCNSLRPGGEERENISHQTGKAGNYSNIPWVGIILVSRR